MRLRFPVFRIFFIPIASFCSFIACSSSSGIDDYFTINVQKSQNFPAPSQSSIGQWTTISLTITIDSSDLVANSTLSTTIPLTKSVKLNKFTLSSSDPTYAITSFDTVKLVVLCDSLADQLLATYTGANDSVSLTNADFAAYVKESSCRYTLIYRANASPSHTMNITAAEVFVFTANPKQ